MIVSVVFGQFAFVIAKSFDVSMEFMNLGIAVFMMVAVVMVAVVGEFVQFSFCEFGLLHETSNAWMIGAVNGGRFPDFILESGKMLLDIPHGCFAMACMLLDQLLRKMQHFLRVSLQLLCFFSMSVTHQLFGLTLHRMGFAAQLIRARFLFRSCQRRQQQQGRKKKQRMRLTKARYQHTATDLSDRWIHKPEITQGVRTLGC
jgi:hypothetical protein